MPSKKPRLVVLLDQDLLDLLSRTAKAHPDFDSRNALVVYLLQVGVARLNEETAAIEEQHAEIARAIQDTGGWPPPSQGA